LIEAGVDILNPIQKNVPAANLVAMYQAVHDAGRS
jgi:hypothetical protein